MPITPTRTSGLSAHELYLFDTLGFLHLPAFLSRDDASKCRTEILRLPSRKMEGRGDKERFDNLTRQSTLIRGLACSAAVRSCVEPLINQPYRLIESYGLRREQDSVFYLHNGNSETFHYGRSRTANRNMSFSHTFHDGKLYCMFVKVLIYLSDTRKADDGPFCYLQGSHKANWPWFGSPDWASTQSDLTAANFPSLAHLHAEAGDAVLLNEALLHGTLPKTSTGERLVMALGYAPAFVSDWNGIDKDSSDLTKLGHY